jgi:hypothetical protein
MPSASGADVSAIGSGRNSFTAQRGFGTVVVDGVVNALEHLGQTIGFFERS